MENSYESKKLLGEYLLFHYGTATEILPENQGPRDALFYPVRCVSECLDFSRLVVNSRALDLGCAVGRSSWELARHCQEVVGIDFSHSFIRAARELQQHGTLAYEVAEEGELPSSRIAVVPPEIPRDRVHFEEGDAQSLRPDLGTFDVVLMANLIDRLANPRRCLHQLPALLRGGGQLIVTSPYTWLEEYTPRAHWLGGFLENGRPVRTLETLKKILSPDFNLLRTLDLPFLIREHSRKFQWSLAQASLWQRK